MTSPDGIEYGSSILLSPYRRPLRAGRLPSRATGTARLSRDELLATGRELADGV